MSPRGGVRARRTSSSTSPFAVNFKAFPALAGSKFVTGDHGELAGVLLKGRGGMPDFSANISDRDMAAILTYVRSDWGNKADALTEAEIHKLRADLGVDQFGSAEMSNKH